MDASVLISVILLFAGVVTGYVGIATLIGSFRGETLPRPDI